MPLKRARARKDTGPRRVQCYLCCHWFEVGDRAMTVSCPKCYKPLMVQDLVIKQHEAVKRLETCGRISVEKRGRVIAERVTAVEGIEVRGVVHANVFSGSQVVMHAGAEWKGDCAAPAIDIKDGARVLGGFFKIPDRTYGEWVAPPPAPEPKPSRKRSAKKTAKKATGKASATQADSDGAGSAKRSKKAAGSKKKTAKKPAVKKAASRSAAKKKSERTPRRARKKA